MQYLPNAPQHLIKISEKRYITGKYVHNIYRPFLGQLLSDERMKRPWNTLRSTINTNTRCNKFLKAVIEAMRLARRGIVSEAERRKRYERITKGTKQLRSLIAEPQRPLSDGSGYRGELDLMAYEFLPPAVATIMGAPSWVSMNGKQRSDWAYGLLHTWPTMAELLDELSLKASELANTAVSMKRRSRRFLKEETDEEITTKTRARLFACYLDEQIRKTITPRFSSAGTIKVIAEIVYGVDLDLNAIKKSILDYRHRADT
jgi:hypothetical protein